LFVVISTTNFFFHYESIGFNRLFESRSLDSLITLRELVLFLCSLLRSVHTYMFAD